MLRFASHIYKALSPAQVAAARDAAANLPLPFYTLPVGAVLFRVDRLGAHASTADNPRFYAFYRDRAACAASPWVDRCRHGNGRTCRFTRVRTARPLKLLLVPYKTLALDDVDDADRTLAAQLTTLARATYGPNDQDALRGALGAVDELVLQQASNAAALPDWTLADFMCHAGFDGFARFVNGTAGATHCYDEVALCDPDVTAEQSVEFGPDAPAVYSLDEVIRAVHAGDGPHARSGHRRAKKKTRACAAGAVGSA